MKRSYIREILDAIDEKTISFAGGLPNEALFPLEALQEASARALSSQKVLQYSKSQGLDELREYIANMYSTQLGFPTTKEEILITTGSQQAFDVIAKVYGKKEVLVQSPTYIGALNAFKLQNIRINAFENHQDLALKLNEKSLVYIMSDFINPTSECLTQNTREQLAMRVNLENSFMVEDGAYSLLDFHGNIHKPIAASVQKSFHLGSFSKIIAPGLRLGWIRAKKEYLEPLLVSKEALDLHSPTLTQAIVWEYLKHNDLTQHLNRVRQDYKQRMEFMSECLKKYLPSFYFVKPQGGMFIYGSFQQESFSLAKEGLKNNVAFVPGSVFYHDSRRSNEARLNFTNASYEQIEKGIELLSSSSKQDSSESIWMNLFSSVFKHPKV